MTDQYLPWFWIMKVGQILQSSKLSFLILSIVLLQASNIFQIENTVL